MKSISTAGYSGALRRRRRHCGDRNCRLPPRGPSRRDQDRSAACAHRPARRRGQEAGTGLEDVAREGQRRRRHQCRRHEAQGRAGRSTTTSRTDSVPRQLAEKLITDDKVDFLLSPFGSGHTKIVATIAERYETPIIACAASSESVFDQSSKYLFGTLSPNAGLFSPMVKYFQEKLPSLKTGRRARPRRRVPEVDGARRLGRAKAAGLDVVLRPALRGRHHGPLGRALGDQGAAIRTGSTSPAIPRT